ncbi:transposase [Bradyrhizobium sp. CSA207]|uniref:transposase n=1 Tax=Bradyrhizobium sp. CSA207 TaxID=2698826 RepID=UPI0023AFB67F|nr:transposase [Bradyrhizobium sp. CSA207]
MAAQQLADDERAATSIGTSVSSTGWRKTWLCSTARLRRTQFRAVNRLMAITGVSLTVAAGIVAAIGDISRFNSPQKLVSYFGLNPRVRQSRPPITAASARSGAVTRAPC